MLEAVSLMKSLQNNNNIVFAVHTIDGSVVMLEELVSHLNSRVYGLQCSKDAPLESLEELATIHISKIKLIQSTGPFKIVGYSFRASVAFEIALQMEKQNEEVELVLLDGSPRWKYLVDISDGETLQDQWENAILLGFLNQYLRSNSPIVYRELAKSQPFEDKRNYTAKVLHESFPNICLEEIKVLISSFYARAECGKKYEPSSKVKAKTVLIKATANKLSWNLPQDYGLTDICEEQLDIIEVEGNHYCFYENPLKLCLPDILNKILD
ncbi:unnamed protein product [Allacma fusca]|uniref:Thioesterase domain-containing protein n=1 Tax=Allacma fusca TaxID=39272 RepID=A0A8J2L9G2_9HEXA|nr:unnamed protein product [Allacma fusca]